MVTTHSSSRVLIIGLDVGDGRLIEQWAREGYLPVINSVMRNGARGSLGTSAEALHVSGWPSLYTGTLPGKHGIYYTYQPAPGLQGARRFGPDQYGYPPLWQLLSEGGKSCVVLDAPYTHPHGHFSGIQVFEWGTWAWYWKPMSTPAWIMRELTRQCGPYPLGFEANQIGLNSLDPAELQERLTKAAACKAKGVQWLMTKAPWDLFMVVFGETHAAAHYCWPSANCSPAAISADTSYKSLRTVYEAVDHAIGAILGSMSDEVTVFIVSVDGVGPNYSGWHLLPEVLQRLGFTAASDRGGSEDSPGSQQDRTKKDLFKRMRDLVPVELRRNISRRLPTRWRDSLFLRWSTANIDWAKTRAYCLPTDLEGCIRINLRGREPQGIVNDGTEYEDICKKLTTCLEHLINPLTGRPAVRQVIRTGDLLPGARRHYLPDLITLWSDEAEITEIHSPEIGVVSAPSPDARTGTHRPPGFMVARGPHVRCGHVLTGGHVVDFAPTVLSQFGMPKPQHMDGSAWRNMWTGR